MDQWNAQLKFRLGHRRRFTLTCCLRWRRADPIVGSKRRGQRLAWTPSANIAGPLLLRVRCSFGVSVFFSVFALPSVWVLLVFTAVMVRDLWKQTAMASVVETEAIAVGIKVACKPSSVPARLSVYTS